MMGATKGNKTFVLPEQVMTAGSDGREGMMICLGV